MSRPIASGRSISGLAFLVICLLILAVVHSSVQAGPASWRWYSGTPGTAVGGPSLRVQVSGVVLARQVAADGVTMPSDHVLMVVYWTAEVHHQRAELHRVELHTGDGLELTQRPEFAQNAPQATEPGFTASGASVFEVRADSLPGSSFAVYGEADPASSYGPAIRIKNLIDTDAPVRETVYLEPSSQTQTEP